MTVWKDWGIDLYKIGVVCDIIISVDAVWEVCTAGEGFAFGDIGAIFVKIEANFVLKRAEKNCP